MAGTIACTVSGIARADSLPVEGRAGILGHQIIGRGSEIVIVLHEWLGDHVNWQPTWPYLDTERFSFVFGELRGYGWSKTIPGTFTLNEAVDDTLRSKRRFKTGIPGAKHVARSMAVRAVGIEIGTCAVLDRGARVVHCR